MKESKYLCQFSPDGKHWINDKKKKLEDAWQWLIKDGRTYKLLNKFAKVRIVNEQTQVIIGDR